LRYGVHVQNSGDFGDAAVLARLARDAEMAGWDGFFIWDHILFEVQQPTPVVDPWVALTAVAMSTERVLLGPLVTPLARRRPWKLARETVSLDRLSGGRLVLGVGLGDRVEEDFATFDEVVDARLRAAKLDESLEILVGLWSGEQFTYSGEHYRLATSVFLPTSAQSPRIPIWVGGEWPNKRPFRRAAGWDGVFPSKEGVALDEMMTPDDLKEIVTYVKANRSRSEPFDVVIGGYTPGDDPDRASHIVAAYREVGVTWWLEGINSLRGPIGDMHVRIRQGPPNA
jgi:alkanesulfonate monooxygenase SsuD/methylene tetrahydromethanopterin reductase-like flavin-dependent oxidoreductase (luciferase family)